MNQRDQILPMEVVVHKKGWQTETVRVQHLGALKDLGYYLDTDLGGGTSIQSHSATAHDRIGSNEV
jgi:hypothetical protein